MFSSWRFYKTVASALTTQLPNSETTGSKFCVRTCAKNASFQNQHTRFYSAFDGSEYKDKKIKSFKKKTNAGDSDKPANDYLHSKRQRKNRRLEVYSKHSAGMNRVSDNYRREENDTQRDGTYQRERTAYQPVENKNRYRTDNGYRNRNTFEQDIFQRQKYGNPRHSYRRDATPFSDGLKNDTNDIGDRRNNSLDIGLPILETLKDRKQKKSDSHTLNSKSEDPKWKKKDISEKESR